MCARWHQSGVNGKHGENRGAAIGNGGIMAACHASWHQ